MKEIVVSSKECNQRLDKFLLKYFGNAPKSFVYKMLRKKRIKLNGGKGEGNEILQKDDTIQMYISDETIDKLRISIELDEKTEINFKVLYEDRNILVISKLAGCLSQKEDEDTKNAIVDQVVFYLWEKGEFDPEKENAFTPALCNRLDRNTSGILIIGKSVTALKEVGEMLKNNKISRYYYALCRGQMKYKETYKAFLSKNSEKNIVTVTEDETPDSKQIVTSFEPIASNDKYTFMSIKLLTGKSHQIRAHLAFLGHAVVGDKKYGHKGTNMTFIRKYDLNHQFLHSYKITFQDIEGDMSYLNGKEIISKMPENFVHIIEDMFPDAKY